MGRSGVLAPGTRALGLTSCGGDETTTSVVVTETVTVEKKSCMAYDHWTLAVEGDISCPEARRLFRGWVNEDVPPGWNCTGPETIVTCTKPPLLISATI